MGTFEILGGSRLMEYDQDQTLRRKVVREQLNPDDFRRAFRSLYRAFDTDQLFEGLLKRLEKTERTKQKEPGTTFSSKRNLPFP